MSYKKSRFNYIVNRKKCFLIYNTLYNSLTRLNQEEYSQFENLNNCSIELLNGLIEQGIIIENSINELELYNIYLIMSII